MKKGGVPRKIILLKSERLVCKNVHPMRRRGIRVCDITWLRTNVKMDSLNCYKQSEESDAQFMTFIK